jgi:hypothetical protein
MALFILPSAPPGPNLLQRLESSPPEAKPLDLTPDVAPDKPAPDRPSGLEPTAGPVTGPEAIALLDEVYAGFGDEPMQLEPDPMALLEASVPALLVTVALERTPVGPDRRPVLGSRPERDWMTDE